MKIVVLGSGVIGVTTAYYLHKFGYEVTVVDRKSVSAAECSFANGGQLSYSHAEPWATPGVLTKIPKWLFKKDSPLVFYPSLDPAMWKWAISFLMNCTGQQSLESTRHTLRLAMYSKECFDKLIADTGVEFYHTKKGTLHVFRDEASLAANIKQAEYQKQFGCDYTILNSRQECENIEPALQGAPAAITSGLHFPMDETGDICEFTVNLAKWLEKNGVKFIFNTSVTGISSDGDKITAIATDKGSLKADSFVVALGASTPLLLKQIGVDIPIYPMKGYSLSINIGNATKFPTTGLTDQYNKIVYSKLGNIIRVAGTAEFAGYNDSIRPHRIDTLKKMVKELFPDCGDIESARPWACLRPSTPKGTPLLGKTPYSNLFLNTGHGTLGWTLSCGSSRIIADIINGKEAEIDLSGLGSVNKVIL